MRRVHRFDDTTVKAEWHKPDQQSDIESPSITEEGLNGWLTRFWIFQPRNSVLGSTQFFGYDFLRPSFLLTHGAHLEWKTDPYLGFHCVLANLRVTKFDSERCIRV
jgi:hypothetical protein